MAERYLFRALLSCQIDRRVDHSRPGFVDFARLVMCCCFHRLGVVVNMVAVFGLYFS